MGEYPEGMTGHNLLDGPDPTLLADGDDVRQALSEGRTPREVVARYPASPLAWSVIAAQAWDEQNVLDAYAYARVGYHRGLDLLRRSGWRGHGPIPADHPGNQGFLTCLRLLGEAAQAIGEEDEAERCAQFYADSTA